MNRTQHFQRAVLHPKSQFAYKGGSSSCTYCSLEASIWLLQGFIFPDDPQLSSRVSKIIQAGVGYDKQLGHRSCDEAYKLIDRFRHSLSLKNLYVHRLIDSVYHKIVKEIMTHDNMKKNPHSVGVILTKPPETILLFYNPKQTDYPFIVFDSHSRTYGDKSGAGFYFFKDENSCANHIRQLYPVNSTVNRGKLSEYEKQKYQMLEANIVCLKPKVDFLTHTTFERIKPVITEDPNKELERDIVSSFIEQKPTTTTATKVTAKTNEQPNQNMDRTSIMLATISTLRRELQNSREELSKYKTLYEDLKKKTDQKTEQDSQNLEKAKEKTKELLNLLEKMK